MIQYRIGAGFGRDSGVFVFREKLSESIIDHVSQSATGHPPVYPEPDVGSTESKSGLF